MSSSRGTEKVDRVLDLLSKPLTRYILAVLAGVDPGRFTQAIESPEERLNGEDRKSQ